MEDTPGSSPLPFAGDEVETLLQKQCSLLHLRPEMPQAYTDAVLEAMKTCTVCHYAGQTPWASDKVQLLDESPDLTSAFQLAGFRHVVGTLWAVSDQPCIDVAKEFYKECERQADLINGEE
ncbi:hypothetical protein FDENT_11727 [Fusarium denticulatum]|uniref:CHAT domain-containing protein n=1 Tax=Fusarium denticulatum TaxID=48507 RepID=A0A8H5TFI7_9HYPO|nr:hypothetical protein FDENT_11727 [Fusarium denticulatum]